MLRPASAADDEGIRALLAQSFAANPKADAAILAWQYWQNPFGEVVSWVWEDAGRVVCHWACVPVPMVVAGRRVVGLKTADAATAPDYRGRGLFRRLAQRLFADCAERGFPLAISHPNPNAARGVEQGGGRLVARVPAYVLPTGGAPARVLPRPVLTGARRVAFSTSPLAAGRVVAGAPEGLDGLWERAGARTRNGVARGAAWWQWRYERRPHARYRFAEVRDDALRAAAAAVEREVHGVRLLYVLELLADDDDAAAAVINALVAEAPVAGAVLVGLAQSRLVRHARAAGFRRLPRRLEPVPLRFMVVDLAQRAEIDPADWEIAWGDLDHL